MTPLEINKKIAEMKSCRVLTTPENVPIYQAKSIHEGGDCNVRKYPDAKIPHWAENIADAWELFEELPNPKLQLFNRDDAGLVRFPWRCTVDFNKDQEFMGETAPLAICNAWLKWKENKK